MSLNRKKEEGRVQKTIQSSYQLNFGILTFLILARKDLFNIEVKIIKIESIDKDIILIYFLHLHSIWYCFLNPQRQKW